MILLCFILSKQEERKKTHTQNLRFSLIKYKKKPKVESLFRNQCKLAKDTIATTKIRSRLKQISIKCASTRTACAALGSYAPIRSSTTSSFAAFALSSFASTTGCK